MRAEANVRLAKWQNVRDSDNENKSGSTEEETERGECTCMRVHVYMCIFVCIRVASIDAKGARVCVFK